MGAPFIIFLDWKPFGSKDGFNYKILICECFHQFKVPRVCDTGWQKLWKGCQDKNQDCLAEVLNLMTFLFCSPFTWFLITFQKANITSHDWHVYTKIIKTLLPVSWGYGIIWYEQTYLTLGELLRMSCNRGQCLQSLWSCVLGTLHLCRSGGQETGAGGPGGAGPVASAAVEHVCQASWILCSTFAVKCHSHNLLSIFITCLCPTHLHVDN